MSELLRTSLVRFDLKESSMMITGERGETLTDLDELWPATFRNLQSEAAQPPNPQPSQQQPLASQTSIRTTNFGGANKQNQPCRNTPNQTASNLITNEYGLKASINPTVPVHKPKRKKYSVTPYIDPTSQSSRKSLIQSRSGPLPQLNIHLQADIQRTAIARQLPKRLQEDNRKKVMLRRPTKQLSGSRITNQAYLTASQYESLCISRAAQKMQEYLSRTSPAAKQRTMSASASPAYSLYRHARKDSRPLKSLRIKPANVKASVETYACQSLPRHRYIEQAPLDAYFTQSRYAPIAVQPSYQRFHSQIMLPYR